MSCFSAQLPGTLCGAGLQAAPGSRLLLPSHAREPRHSSTQPGTMTLLALSAHTVSSKACPFQGEGSDCDGTVLTGSLSPSLPSGILHIEKPAIQCSLAAVFPLVSVGTKTSFKYTLILSALFSSYSSKQVLLPSCSYYEFYI